MKHLISNYITDPFRKSFDTMKKEIDRARHIARTLGYRVAAAYLRNHGWSVEAAVWILLRKESRDHA